MRCILGDIQSMNGLTVVLVAGRTLCDGVFRRCPLQMAWWRRRGATRRNWRKLEKMSEVKLISGGLFEEVADLAMASPRHRMNRNLHDGPNDNAHRFLNVLLRGTYIRPHLHSTPPKAETIWCWKALADAILFDDRGAITARYSLGADTPEGRLWGVDLPAGLWLYGLAADRAGGLFRSQAGALGAGQR